LDQECQKPLGMVDAQEPETTMIRVPSGPF